jgi:hypothetical protein
MRAGRVVVTRQGASHVVARPRAIADRWAEGRWPA